MWDVRIRLEDVSTRAPTASPPASRRREMLWFVAGLAAAAVVIRLWAPRDDAPAPAPQVIRTSISLPSGLELDPNSMLAISPDGTRLVYEALEGETRRLYLRNRNESDARVIPGTV